MPATATKAAKETTTIRPAQVEDQWNSIAILSMLGFGSVSSLVDKANEVALRLDILPEEITPRFFCDDDDLELLLGEDGARKARDYRPAWGSVLPGDKSKLGLADDAVDEEVAALCLRRGVPTFKDPVFGDQIDRKALEQLSRLLERERRFPESEFDTVMGESIAQAMSATCKTPVPAEAPARPKPAPYVNPDPFVAKPVEPAEPRLLREQWEKYDPDFCVREQCRILAVRPVKLKFDRERAVFLGFDAYRLANIIIAQSSRGPSRKSVYDGLMTRAYHELFA